MTLSHALSHDVTLADKSHYDQSSQSEHELKRSLLFLALFLIAFLMSACHVKAPTESARVFQNPSSAKAGSYKLAFHLDGENTLPEFLAREKVRNPSLAPFSIPELERLFRIGYPQLYQPVQPGIPLCHMEQNFKHCRGIELLADLDIYQDQTVVLHSRVFYHVRLRIESGYPNFFRSAMAQRDRGEFALPRHFYLGELIDTIQRGLPILREIATDYRKYIKDNEREIEIELTLEAAPAKAAAKLEGQQIRDSADLGGGFLLSSLPSLPFFASLTVSALYSGGKTFWEVLKEENTFDIYKRDLALDEVTFSYRESFSRNFSHFLKSSTETPSTIIVRAMSIRLRDRKQPIDQTSLPVDDLVHLREGSPECR